MTEGVVGATEQAFHKHPLLWGGILIGVVVIGYVFTRGGSTPTVISYPIGPSDAAVQAGTQLQIAQVGANASNFQAATQATERQSEVSSYLDYMTKHDTLSAGVTTQAINADAYTKQIGLNDALTASVSHDNLGVVTSNNTLATVQSNNGVAWHVSDNGVLVSNNATNLGILQSNNDTSVANYKTEVQHEAIAVNAAATGSVLYQNSLTNDRINSELWSAIQSGQSQSYIDALQKLGASQMIALPSASNGGWQS